MKYRVLFFLIIPYFLFSQYRENDGDIKRVEIEIHKHMEKYRVCVYKEKALLLHLIPQKDSMGNWIKGLFFDNALTSITEKEYLIPKTVGTDLYFIGIPHEQESGHVYALYSESSQKAMYLLDIDMRTAFYSVYRISYLPIGASIFYFSVIDNTIVFGIDGYMGIGKKIIIHKIKENKTSTLLQSFDPLYTIDITSHVDSKHFSVISTQKKYAKPMEVRVFSTDGDMVSNLRLYPPTHKLFFNGRVEELPNGKVYISGEFGRKNSEFSSKKPLWEEGIYLSSIDTGGEIKNYTLHFSQSSKRIISEIHLPEQKKKKYQNGNYQFTFYDIKKYGEGSLIVAHVSRYGKYSDGNLYKKYEVVPPSPKKYPRSYSSYSQSFLHSTSPAPTTPKYESNDARRASESPDSWNAPYNPSYPYYSSNRPVIHTHSYSIDSVKAPSTNYHPEELFEATYYENDITVDRLVTALDTESNILWQNSFEVPDTLGENSLWIHNHDKYPMFVSHHKNTIYLKTIFPNKIEEQTIPLSFKYPNDSIKLGTATIQSGDDNSLYIYGVQHIKNLKDKNVPLNRKVFYITRVTINE